MTHKRKPGRDYPHERRQVRWTGDSRGFIRDELNGFTVGLFCTGKNGVSPHEFAIAAAAPALYDALKLAQCALNDAPRFKVHGMPVELDDSYKIAHVVDAALRDAEIGTAPGGVGYIAKLRGRYPFRPWHSGGGCMALRLPLDENDDKYILLTDEDAAIPTEETDQIVCGLYLDPDGDDAGLTVTLPPSQVQAWLERTLKTIDNPTVYDYRACALEQDGLTRSDAQGVVDAELMQS